MATRSFQLGVHAPFTGPADGTAAPAAAAFVFSAGGHLLGQSPLGDKGEVSFTLDVPEGDTQLRVVVGPADAGQGDDGDQDKPSPLVELLRRGAVERHLRVPAKSRALQVALPLSPDLLIPWFRRCLVKGTLLKRDVREGVAIDLPVCHATVEVYEVDPLPILIDRLPQGLIERLRAVIRRPIPLPDPPPDVRRGAAPDPADDPHASPDAIAAMHAAAGSPVLRHAALAAGDAAFKETLLAHPTLVRPLLCWLHPKLVTMQRVGTAVTDECGHFRTFIWKSLLQPDQPDLYFKARQRRFGFLQVTIFAPTPVACHTRWNYVCGTEVTLRTQHPLAVTCAPCRPYVVGDNWVLFMAIGNLALSRIAGTGGDMPAGGIGLTEDNAPFGGLLRPRIEFDSALRDGLGVRHYRLSWKRDSEPDTAYRHLNAPISRHYAHMLSGELVVDAYPLGPVTVGAEGNLFEIPPTVPPLGQWSLPDVVEGTASGHFNTVTADGSPLLDGLVQLRLELFTDAGAPVNIAALGVRYFVPTSTDLSGTVNTADASTLGLVVGNTMVVTLHVNNEDCTAAIAPPSISGVEADPCCGVLHYGSGASVHLAWQAVHPHGFATHDFSVVRGVNGVFSVDDAPVAGGSFSTTRTVAQLMNDNLPAGCTPGGCTVAGFSEQLYVAATATDGWSRQSGRDDSAVRAFVLSPD